MPNMATTRLIKAANHPTTWEYRHDIALADGLPLPQDPHPFLALFIGISGTTVQFPSLDGILIGLAAQQAGGGVLRLRRADRAGPQYVPAVRRFRRDCSKFRAHLPEDNDY